MSDEAGGGRVLITGAAGMLGSELLLSAPTGVEVVGADVVAPPVGNPEVAYVGADLTDPDQVAALIREVEPTGVIHAAAYTAVDKAEEEEDLARRINADASENLARIASARALALVMVSTDFVFDGTKGEPYLPDDPTAPLGVYGRTKLEGELRARDAHPEVRIVRTQWLYGPRGNHFPGTMLRLAGEREELKVVSDQVGSPTSTLELAPALWDVLGKGEARIYHGACEGRASWYDFAVATLELAGSATRILPCTTEEFPRPAPRPAFSVLDCSRLTQLRGRPFKPWRSALADFLVHEAKPAG